MAATTDTSAKKCMVCGSEAHRIYFGALVCLPCKSFFIRCSKTNDQQQQQLTCVCYSAPLSCRQRLPSAARVRCQACRYERCLQAGMTRKVKPDCVDVQEGQERCRVCGDLANGFHFGTFTCEGCKKFFRRGLQEYETYSCAYDADCVVNPRTRNDCRFCRYQKCLSVGMAIDAIKMGRPRKIPDDPPYLMSVNNDNQDGAQLCTNVDKLPDTGQTLIRCDPVAGPRSAIQMLLGASASRQTDQHGCEPHRGSARNDPLPPMNQNNRDKLTIPTGTHAIDSLMQLWGGVTVESAIYNWPTNNGVQSRILTPMDIQWSVDEDHVLPQNMVTCSAHVPLLSARGGQCDVSLIPPQSGECDVSRGDDGSESIICTEVLGPANINHAHGPGTMIHEQNPAGSSCTHELADISHARRLSQDSDMCHIAKHGQGLPILSRTDVTETLLPLQTQKRPENMFVNFVALAELNKALSLLDVSPEPGCIELNAETSVGDACSSTLTDSASLDIFENHLPRCNEREDIKPDTRIRIDSYFDERYWTWPRESQPVMSQEFGPDSRTLIDISAMSYKSLVSTCEAIDQQNVLKDRPWPKLGEEGDHWKYIQRRIVMNTQACASYIARLPGFCELCEDDRAYIGGMAALFMPQVIALCEWYDPNKKTFQHYFDWHVEERNPVYLLREALLQHAHRFHRHNIDDVERALIGPLLVFASDWCAIREVAKVDRVNAHYMNALQGYLKVQGVAVVPRIQQLMKLMLRSRQLSLWHKLILSHAMTNLSSVTSGQT